MASREASGGGLLSLGTATDAGLEVIKTSAGGSEPFLLDEGREHAIEEANEPVPSHRFGVVNTIGGVGEASLIGAKGRAAADEEESWEEPRDGGRRVTGVR